MQDPHGQAGKNEEIQQVPPTSEQTGEALVPQSPLKSLDRLIATEQNSAKIRELLALKDIVLRQQWQENQIQEIKEQRNYDRFAKKNQERTTTIASSLIILISLGMIYIPSSYQSIGIFILVMAISALLRVPFNDVFEDLFRFIGKFSKN
jgi:hypothetical protein